MSQNGTNDSKAAKRAPCRLVVMFDGTANTRVSMTNVSRMFEAIDDSLPESYKCIGSDAEDLWPPSEFPASTKVVPCGACNQPVNCEGDDSKAYFRAGVPCGSCHQLVLEPERQPVQKVKYIAGVDREGGIAWLPARCRLYHLSDKIKEGYIWLCQNYESEDDVFVFGFSQGAFAARILVSLLHACGGVLKKSEDYNKVFKTAYKYYWDCAKSPVEKNEANRSDFITYLQQHDVVIEPLDHLPLTVKMLGVWETVGNFVIPETDKASSIKICGTEYQFHDQYLSSNVDNAYHALALDEDLEPFKPILWRTRANEKQEVKQVWFAGSHCNVGGGADLDDNVDPDDLWQYSYVWMQRHAEKHGLRFYWSFEYPASRQAESRTRLVSEREPRPSSKNFVRMFTSWHGIQSTREFDPKLAMLHWSVLERIKVWDKSEPGPTQLQKIKARLHKIWARLSDLNPWSDFGMTTYGDPKPWPKPYLLPKSLVKIYEGSKSKAPGIPEGETPDKVGTRKCPIDTDDVSPCTHWMLPVSPETDDVSPCQWILPLRSKATEEWNKDGKEKGA